MTLDGKATNPYFPNLTEEEKVVGQRYGMLLPSFFMVAHHDYVRAARILPIGPEKMELSMTWLFQPDAMERDDFDLDHAIGLSSLVVE